jgi:hypothetical protein
MVPWFVTFLGESKNEEKSKMEKVGRKLYFPHVIRMWILNNRLIQHLANLNGKGIY